MDKLSKENQEWLEKNIYCDYGAAYDPDDVEAKLLEMESKLKQANEWISVKDRLPYDIFDWVLVFADGAMSTLGYTKDNGFYEVHPIKTQVNINKITHWMPLPNPPTGE